MPSPSDQTNLVDQIDALLPQTQCTRCGYPACRPYAQAIANNEAPINRCPPGGSRGISELSALLDTPSLPLDPTCGNEGPRLLATIEPEHCIGCTKCIVACPVDAIIGGPKFMHTVLPALCTGCELCVPPCPVDCILIEPLGSPWSTDDARIARNRYEARQTRLTNNDPVLSSVDEQSDGAMQSRSSSSPTAKSAADRKARMIEQAIARARTRRDA